MVDTGEFYLNFYYVFDLVTDAVLIVDQRDTVRYLNKSAETLLGMVLARPESVTCHDIQQRLGVDCFDNEAKEALSRRAEYRTEFPFTTADGGTQWLELRINRLLLPGTQETGYFSLLRDITANKEQEAQQRELQKQLQRIHRQEAITRLAGGIAHDFNNLMTSFLGNLDLLRMTLSEEQAVSDMLDDLDRAATRATELTAQLLSFSRRKQSKLQPIRLDHVLRDPLASLRRALPPNIRLRVRMDSSAAGILGDPQLVHEVLNHLTDNAVEAMPEGGQLRVSVQRRNANGKICRTCGNKLSGFFTELRVEDTGLGMDRLVMDKLFEPFFSTKSGSQSRGLGLPTVYGNVRHQRGHILVESEPNGGTRVSVLFPESGDAADNPECLPADRVIHAHPSGTATVPAPDFEATLLVVEHDRLLRTVNGSMLSNLGFQLITVETAREANLYLETHVRLPDALLIDESLPEMDVSAYVRAWLHRAPYGVVVILSTVEERHRATGYGPNDIVEVFPKSFTPDLLGRRLRELLADRKGTSAG